MARGFPDWFGQSIFPTWGQYTQHLIAHNHSGTGVIDTVQEQTGKGIVRGADLHLANTGQDGDLDNILYFNVDGVVGRILSEASFSSNVSGKMHSAHATTVRMIWEDSHISLIMTEDIPFITSFALLWYAVFTAGAPAITGHIDYSLYT